MLDKLFTSKVQPYTNPFTHKGWQSGSITFFKRFDGVMVYNALLCFRHGGTTGQQSFDAEDFEGLLVKMGTFLDNLEQK